MSGIVSTLQKAAAAKEVIDTVMHDIDWVSRSAKQIIGPRRLERLSKFNPKAASAMQRKFRLIKRVGVRKRRKLQHNQLERSTHSGNVFTGGLNAAKKTQILQSLIASVNTRTVTKQDLSVIERVSNVAGGLTNDKRVGDVIHMSGAKLNFFIENGSAVPIGCNVAIVVPRNESSLNVTLPIPNFFGGNSDTRGEAFDLATKTGLELHTLPLNTDKFEVLYHKRKILGRTFAAGGVTTSTDAKSWGLWDDYIPINKEIRYTDGTGASAVSAPCVLVWFDSMRSPTGAAAFAGCLVARHLTVFWREKL